MAYSIGSENQATAAKPASLQSALEDFDPALERLEKLAHRAMNCADRIVGSRPSEVAANGKDVPSPNHLVYGLQVRRTRLVGVVDYLETEIQRIENGLT